MHRIRIAMLALVLAAGSARAGIENAGTTAGNFLSVGTGASVLAMGGAAIAAGDDINAAAWNPAALARLGSTQFALSHAVLAQLSSQDLASAGGRLGHGATRWGASVLYQGDGSFDGRDALGVPTGSFSASSMAVGVQVARPLGNLFTAGLGARWLNDNLGDATGSGLAFDAGLQAHAGSLGLGVAARNFGGSMAYPSGRFDLPAVYGVGASWSDVAHGLRLALDANFPAAYYNDVRVGGEWRWQDRLALRAGYRMELGAAIGEPLAGPSFGLGAGANGLWMDYAFLAGNGDAQGQHRIALTFHPSMPGRSRPVADAGAIAPRVFEVLVATQTSADSVIDSSGVPRALTMMEQLALDVADRLPPGGIESESSPRELVPLHALAASQPVKIAPLVIMKPTGSISDADESKPAPVAVRTGLVPPVVKTPNATRVTVVRPGSSRPTVTLPVAAPASARAAVIRPVSSSNPAAPVVVTRPAPAPVVSAPVAAARPVAGPPVASAPAAVARIVAALPIVSAPVAAARSVVAAPIVAAPVAAPVAAARVVAAPPVVSVPVATPPVAAARVVAPPVVTAPVATPPVAAARVVAPPVVTAPVATPPVAAARVVAPPVVTAPVAAPPVAAARIVAPPVVTAPVASPPVAVARVVAPPVVTAPVTAPPVAAAPVAARVIAPPPVVSAPAAAPPVVSAPVAAAPAQVSPVVPAMSAPVAAVAAPDVSPDLAVNHPVRAVRAPHAEPAPKPEAVTAPASPEVTPSSAAPESAATPAVAPEPAAPEPTPVAPPAPAPAPAPARPAKSSSWPRVSAAMPTVHYAGVTNTVAVVAVPQGAPATEPIVKPTGPRPQSVQVKGNETLADIAKRWDTSVAALMMENNLVTTTLKGGQKLTLPPAQH